jgi:hypothetical protein
MLALASRHGYFKEATMSPLTAFILWTGTIFVLGFLVGWFTHRYLSRRRRKRSSVSQL